MKQTSLVFITFFIVSFMNSCEHKEYDYYAHVVISLQMPDDIKVLKVHGTMELKNISNGRIYSSSDFKNNTIELEVLRGAYMLDTEGTLVCIYPNGHEEVKVFRASNNYVELVENNVQIVTEIILM